MTEDIVDRLEVRAKAATPGPWTSPAPGRIGTEGGRRTEIGILRRVADADYVAAADPQTVLSLIAEMRRWKLYAESLRDAMHEDEPAVWEQVRDALMAIGPGAPSPSAQDMVERLMAEPQGGDDDGPRGH
jgi:hypothetical protein